MIIGPRHGLGIDLPGAATGWCRTRKMTGPLLHARRGLILEQDFETWPKSSAVRDP